MKHHERNEETVSLNQVDQAGIVVVEKFEISNS